MHRTIRLFLRAALLRCPDCGNPGIFRNWLALRDSCPRCGLALVREEGYWTGAWALNLVVAELLFALGLLVWIVLSWPNPPWTLIQIGAVVGVVLAPIAFWPHSRTLWLALTLAVESDAVGR